MFLFQLLIQDPIQFLIMVLIMIVPLLISITFHEWAHGYVAFKFGDPTPKMAGRLTLNPFAHLDLVGTIMLFIIGIGWAKPVPVNILNIPNRTNQMLVALAGPMSNVILAVIFTIILVIYNNSALAAQPGIINVIPSTINIIVKINLILAMFNMIPIPPLDGSRVLAWMMPVNLANRFYMLEPYGLFIIMALLFTVGFKFIFQAADFVQDYLIQGISLLLNFA